MSFSHLTRVRNEIATLEKESDKYVPRECYYVIEIRFPNAEISREQIGEWGKNAILNKEHQPLFVYVRQKELFLFFSCVEHGEHFLGGGHQELCSRYSSEFTQKLLGARTLPEKAHVVCKLVELETQNKIFMYLLWKNTECWFRFLSSFLEEPLEKVYQRTLQETLDMANADNSLDSLPKSKKYGIIYKLKEKKGRTVISSFSKLLDARRKDHYISHLFV